MNCKQGNPGVFTYHKLQNGNNKGNFISNVNIKKYRPTINNHYTVALPSNKNNMFISGNDISLLKIINKSAVDVFIKQKNNCHFPSDFCAQNIQTILFFLVV